MLIQFTGPPPKPTEAPTQIIPAKALDLCIDSLEWDNNIHFEQKFPTSRRYDI